MNFDILRKNMVSNQIIARGITNQKVIEVLNFIPREKFVPQDQIDYAYDDCPVAIGMGQTISQPYIVALMTQALALTGNERVLEIGTGSGYQTAILAKLAKEVYTIERIEELYLRSKMLFTTMGFKNIYSKLDDGTLGWGAFAPFDRIIITAAASRVSLPLSDQLVNKGMIVAPVGDQHSQILTVFLKEDSNNWQDISICKCVFVPLIGKFGLDN